MSPTLAPKQEARAQHLSVDFEKQNVSRAIPQARASFVSAQTIVTDNPNFKARRAAIKRRSTHVAVVKLSWWDCMKAALFGTKNLKRQLAATVEWAEVEDTHEQFFDERDNPYMLMVSVYKRDSSDFTPARCVLDTGCAQGNIISVDLARRLGFTEADFQPLTPRESNGGMAASGHIHKPLGTIRVSWFHSTSAKVFNTMRFLVSETANVDIVIGTRSICKENLLSPPNLRVGENKYTDLNKESDMTRETFVDEIATLETDVINAERDISKTKEDTKERATAQRSLKKAKAALQVANWKLELYDVTDRLLRKNSEKTQRALLDTKKGLEAKLASKEKKQK